MDPASARNLARKLLDEHGFSDWRFAFDRARRRFGACFSARKMITLSAHLVRLNSPDEVRDTILHEIAHAMTPGDGHGRKWKAACVRIGARPKRTFSESDGVAVPRTGLRVGCPRCGWWVDRHRVTWRLQVCRKCRGEIAWEHVPTGQRYRIEKVPGGYRAVRMPHAVAMEHAR